MTILPSDEDRFSLTERDIRRWADIVHTGDLVLAELDLHLADLVARIARSEVGGRMVFKGGTALNKLYFHANSRLSVDLDFNMVGDERETYSRRKETRLQLAALAADAGLEAHKFKTGKDGDHYTFHYASVLTGTRQPLKVELSFVERFAALGIIHRDMEAPELGRRLATVQVRVQTAPLTELIATKIRALHQRRKGRDLFDLRMAMELIDEPVVLRKLVLYDFAASGRPFEPTAFFKTLDDKLAAPRFRDDLAVYVKPGVPFDWDTDAPRVRAWLAEVMTLDETDADFRHAARLSEPARTLSTDDLRRIIALAPPEIQTNSPVQ